MLVIDMQVYGHLTLTLEPVRISLMSFAQTVAPIDSVSWPVPANTCYSPPNSPPVQAKMVVMLSIFLASSSEIPRSLINVGKRMWKLPGNANGADVAEDIDGFSVSQEIFVKMSRRLRNKFQLIVCGCQT